VTAEYPAAQRLYGNLTSQHAEAVESQYHSVPLGSALALTDDNQQITDTYGYAAFGEVIEHTGNTVNPFQFKGDKQYYCDVETAAYQGRTRTVDADQGRWLSRGPAQVPPLQALWKRG